MGLFPPPACRAERGGRGAAGGCAPKAGDAFRGGVKPSVPVVRNLPGGKHSAPPTTFREMRPARPAGGGLPRFCRLPGVYPLRPTLEHPARNIEFR